MGQFSVVQMAMEQAFDRLIDAAPHVTCPLCMVEMNVRTVIPVRGANEYTATYRCPQCCTDTQREFATGSGNEGH